MTDMEIRLLEMYARGVTAARVNDMLQEAAPVLRESAASLSDTVKTLEDEARGLGARLVTRVSEGYPARLLDIPDPPIALYMRGDPNIPMERVAAPAGSREITPYGVSISRRMGRAFAQNGITLVCGLSDGVDATAARACLDAGGRVVGVLAGGLDVVYPRGASDLYRRIAETSLLITEFRPKSRPYSNAFIARNRLISGLSDAVIMVEARRESGAHHTLNHALEQGKEVFAVPGNIDSPMSVSPNALIRQGANILTSMDDLFEVMGWEVLPDAPAGKAPATLSVEEALVIRALKGGALEFDRLAAACAMSAAKLNSLLTRLEMRGIIVQSAGRRYALSET